MTATPATRTEPERRRVVHGWAFRTWTPDQYDAIRHYIATGEMLDSFPANYRKLHETVQ